MCLMIRINHRSFPSLCIGENHGTVLEFVLNRVSGRINLQTGQALCLFFWNTNGVQTDPENHTHRILVSPLRM